MAIIKTLNEPRIIGGDEVTHFLVESFIGEPGDFVIKGSYGIYENGVFIPYTFNSFITMNTIDFPELTGEEIAELTGGVDE